MYVRLSKDCTGSGTKEKSDIATNCSNKENWIEGGGDRVSVHFAVTFLDCWKTSFCVTTILKIVNNNTNEKQTSGTSGALDEDSPHTNSCLFTLLSVKPNNIFFENYWEYVNSIVF